ncbi:MAG: LamB/YcsF family protein [Microbacteriaceae bacterium]|nr:MAG: LamB/YcsF family protein [Microbacteriaceae bacterium]
MGESIGIHSFGNDEGLLEIVDTVNVACGVHAGDPTSIRRVVEQAIAAGVTIGAHPGLPDLSGFGRREMAIDADETRDLIRYQVGALVGFLEASGSRLHHIKAHGALFSMMASSEELMNALCDVALQYDVPVYGLSGTVHERVARHRGVPFVSEFYVDLEYLDDGTIVVNRKGKPQDLDRAAARAAQALRTGTTTSHTGRILQVRVDSICVHSDLPDAIALATRLRALLNET